MEDSWFVVNLLYKSIKTGQKKVPSEFEEEEEEVEVYEERHFLIRANDQEQAESIGGTLGHKNEHSYENIYGEQVLWKYEKLLECFEMTDELENGAEIYSRYILAPKGITTAEVIERYFPEE